MAHMDQMARELAAEITDFNGRDQALVILMRRFNVPQETALAALERAQRRLERVSYQPAAIQDGVGYSQLCFEA